MCARVLDEYPTHKHAHENARTRTRADVCVCVHTHKQASLTMLQSHLPQRQWVAPEEWLAGQGLALQYSCSSGSGVVMYSGAAVVLQSELFFSSFFSGQAALKLSKTGRAITTRHHLCPNSNKGRRVTEFIETNCLQCSRLPPPLTSLHLAPAAGCHASSPSPRRCASWPAARACWSCPTAQQAAPGGTRSA